MPLTPGEVFARYTIVRLLGTGGMGEVYLAEHPRLPRRDALKILGTDVSADEDYRQRFIREADLAATLWHPNIVRINDRGEFNRQLWISMDFVDGTDAASLMRDRYPAGMPADEVAKIIAAVASALDYAHQHDVLHRDVKPGNILLAYPHHDEQRILLSDFGIARNIGDVSGLTATNMTMGTLPYAAPEQLMDEPIDGRADQYALAATAYHLLTGSPLFPQSNPAVVISRHLNAPPPTLATARPELAALDPVLAVALAKDPTDRFARCTDFARTFAERAATRAQASAAPTTPAPATQKPVTSVPPAPTAPRRAAAVPPAHSSSKRVASRHTVVIASTLAVIVIGALSWTALRIAQSQSEKSAAPTQPTVSSHPPTAANQQVLAAPAPPSCGDGQALLASMSTRDKLAQLLMVGVKNAADARAVVSSDHVGGINIASWTDLSMLTDGSLADIAGSAGPLPLAVSVDEEGGRVSRLSSLIGSAPSPRTLAQTETPDQVYQLALDRGRKMRNLGITIDFAPVVDVTDAPDNTVIGDRSFSADPAVVTTYAGAYARGLRDAGLLPVLKHFPGYGRASGDSHEGAVVTPPLSDLQNVDLVPYRTLVAQAPVGVMIGHLQVPGLTDTDPASLSPAAIGLLRNAVGYGGPPFDGPVFTDDLFFTRAINGSHDIANATLKAIRAGADNALSLSTEEVPTVLDRLESAVAGGELTIANVDASVLRMAAVKGRNPRCGH